MSRSLDRTAALELVRERVGAPNLVNHCVATEIIMEALARHFGLPDEEIARFGLAGLLHDLDYAETSDDYESHGMKTAEALSGLLDAGSLHAILAHAGKAPLQSLMDRALYAADPTTGFIVAAALVRPDRSLSGVEVSSLLKRFKEKSFARGANREQIDTCQEMGLSREEFLGISLRAMQKRAAEIGL